MGRLSNPPDVALERVEWRIDSDAFERSGGHVARFVPYLDSRDVAAGLDEWVGCAGWSDTYEWKNVPDGKGDTTAGIVCTIAIRDPESGEWVSKTDIGVPSNMEAAKGGVSDAFKRCASIKWGVGRSVYELPTIWAKVELHKGKPRASRDTAGSIKAELKRLGITAESIRTQFSNTETDVEVATEAPPPRDTGQSEKKGADEARITDAQLRKLAACFNDHGITDRAERLSYAADFVGRELTTSKQLTKAEAKRLIDELEATKPKDAA